MIRASRLPVALGVAAAAWLSLSSPWLAPTRAQSDGRIDGPPARLGGLAVDEIATATIREATTAPEYSSTWVDRLPEHPTVPSPRDVLGYTIGTPGKLSHVADIHRYMRRLAESSPRAQLFSLGRSFEGREMIMLAIADESVVAQLEKYRGYLHELADPRACTPERAREILDIGKPIYWITAGLHSTELGPPETTMELAYRLVVEEREPFTRIREGVITLITPVLEPDGRDRQVDWYFRYTAGHTKYDDMPRRSPPYWGHYTFHDNNRDGIAVSQSLTANYLSGFFRWLPTVSLDMHESVPLLYVSTGTGPYNERVDPLTVGEWHTLANYEVARLTGLGLPGVWTWGFYTGWYPGYLLWVTNNHNAMGRFFETFGNGSAETMERELKNQRYAGKKITTKQWYRSVPPPAKLRWSMRNNVNYMQSGALASLEMVAKNGRTFLEQFHQKANNAIEQGRRHAPHAFVIPREQRDLAATRGLIGILEKQGIELIVAEHDASFGETEIRAGDIVVKLDQPYGPLARNLLEKQEFPAEVEVRPYDDIAWTLGLHMGVTTHAIDDAAVLDLECGAVDPRDPLGGGRAAEGLRASDRDKLRKAKFIVVPARAQRELGPLRFDLGNARVLSAAESFRSGKRDFAAGSLLVPTEDNEELDVDALIASLDERRLPAFGLGRLPDITSHELELPRLAVFHTWNYTQDSGWVRFTLDTAGVPYTLIAKDRVKAGDLRRDFDVILVPNQSGSASLKSIIGGLDPKWGPMPYTRNDQTPSHGLVDRSPDITGGMGLTGLEELRRFVLDGGALITLASAGALVAESGFAREVSLDRASGLHSPGSMLTARSTENGSPLLYGFEEYTHVFRGNGPLFPVAKRDAHVVALRFGSKRPDDEDDTDGSDDEAEPSEDAAELGEEGPPLVLSGGVVGADKIDGQPALLDIPLGTGRVIMMAWNPMHRFLNHHDHAFVYNAILHWNDHAPENPAPSE